MAIVFRLIRLLKYRSMQKKTTLILTVALLLMCLATPTLSFAQCPGLAGNGDMEIVNMGEDLPAGYYFYFDPAGTGSAAITTTTPDGSATAVEATAGGGNFAGFAQFIAAVTAGTEYTFSADVNATVGQAGLYISWRDGTNAEVDAAFSGNTNAGDGFTNLSLSSVAPANATSVQLAINFNNGTVISDNFCFVEAPVVDPEVPGCAGNLIVNGTFNGNTLNYFDYSASSSVFAFNATEGVDGGGSGELSSDPGQGFYGFGQQFNNNGDDTPIAAGTGYLLRVEAKRTNAAGFANMTLKFKDSGNADVGPSLEIPITTTELEPYELGIILPPGIPATRVEVGIVAGSGAGVVADNFCLTEGFIQLPPATCAGTNLAADFGFENGTEWWADADWTCRANDCSGDNIRDVADAATGSLAVRIEGQSGDPGTDGYNALSLPFTAVAGSIYTVMTSLKKLSTEYGQVHIYWDNGMDEIVIPSADVPNDSGWATYTGVATAPAGATAGELVFEMGNTGFFLVDDVCLTEQLVLPVTLTAFEGEALEKFNNLSWTTASEENTEMFLLERSPDGYSGWSVIGQTEAAGNSRAELTYEMKDEAPPGRAFYRLRSVDFDGSQQLSEVIMLERAIGRVFRVYPNPFSGELSVLTTMERDGRYELTDVLGRTLMSGFVPEGEQQIRLTTENLPQGRYFLRLGGQTVKVVK